LNLYSWPRRASRFLTGFVSMSEPGRKALMTPTSTERPPLTRSATRPAIGCSFLYAASI